MVAIITFIGGCAIGGLLSWVITHAYYVKGAREQRAADRALAEQLRPRTTLRDFEELLTTSGWTKTFIDHVELWSADTDNTFQIERGYGTLEFTQPWTTGHPDPKSTADPVYLKISGTVIKELTFVSMDGGRIFVPIAESRPDGQGGREFFWDINSLPVKVCRIIGAYYVYGSLEELARVSKVRLVE